MADKVGYIKSLRDILGDYPQMDFNAYRELVEAFEDNPKFNPLTAIVFYLDIIHGLMERDRALFDEITEDIEDEVEKLLNTCPDCGKTLFSVIDGGKAC